MCMYYCMSRILIFDAAHSIAEAVLVFGMRKRKRAVISW